MESLGLCYELDVSGIIPVQFFHDYFDDTNEAIQISTEQITDNISRYHTAERHIDYDLEESSPEYHMKNEYLYDPGSEIFNLVLTPIDSKDRGQRYYLLMDSNAYGKSAISNMVYITLKIDKFKNNDGQFITAEEGYKKFGGVIAANDDSGEVIDGADGGNRDNDTDNDDSDDADAPVEVMPYFSVSLYTIDHTFIGTVTDLRLTETSTMIRLLLENKHFTFRDLGDRIGFIGTENIYPAVSQLYKVLWTWYEERMDAVVEDVCRGTLVYMLERYVRRELARFYTYAVFVDRRETLMDGDGCIVDEYTEAQRLGWPLSMPARIKQVEFLRPYFPHAYLTTALTGRVDTADEDGEETVEQWFHCGRQYVIVRSITDDLFTLRHVYKIENKYEEPIENLYIKDPGGELYESIACVDDNFEPRDNLSNMVPVVIKLRNHGRKSAARILLYISAKSVMMDEAEWDRTKHDELSIETGESDSDGWETVSGEDDDEEVNNVEVNNKDTTPDNNVKTYIDAVNKIQPLKREEYKDIRVYNAMQVFDWKYNLVCELQLPDRVVTTNYDRVYHAITAIAEGLYDSTINRIEDVDPYYDESCNGECNGECNGAHDEPLFIDKFYAALMANIKGRIRHMLSMCAADECYLAGVDSRLLDDLTEYYITAELFAS